MGYKTEINYILKASSPEEGVMVDKSEIGDKLIISKSGFRTFVLGSPILLANEKWEIVGMCEILKTETSKDSTTLKAVVLSKLSPEESKVLTRVIQNAEKVKGTYF